MMASRFFVRSMASAAKSVKPPVQLFGVDGTYANALYSASVQESSVEKTYQFLGKINELVESDSQVKDFLHNPALTKDDRSAVIQALSSGLKLDKTTTNFLNVLAEYNRLGNFQNIYKEFSTLNDAHQGLVEAKVTSVKPLDSKILKRLQASIGKSSFVGDGKTLKLTNDVNPDILGGLIVEVGDRTVDLSVSAKIAKLNNTLGEAL
mmetsp:Transcript_734/g.853  ORF Transcript_734/g.853 Transcript_734/m.853 type:complete len:207 (-) Transcript_734:468-1088(-)